MDFAIKSSFNNEREHLATLDKSLHFNHPLVRLREARVRNTACGQRMDVVINAALVNKRNQFNLISFCPPKIETARQELDVKYLALNEAIRVQILREKNSLQVAELKLKALDPLKPLEQGFAYAYHDGGSAVTSVNAVTSGDVIHVQVADGVIDCVVQ
jgi:exonuclease VII large subunit